MLWIRGGRVFDTLTGTFEPRDLAIRAERIERVLDPDSGQPDPSDIVIDSSGMFLLPGLIDCHVHLTVDSRDADPAAGAEKPDAEVADYAEQAAERALLGGVTSVRDLGAWAPSDLVRQIADGSRIVINGP